MKALRCFAAALAFGFLFSSMVIAQDKPWFTAEKMAEGVWRIDDNGSDNMYLVVGAKKALLIDTGLGQANLAEFVKTLTDKPVTVINTHGHPDHAGGNYHFKTVYADAADFELVRQNMPSKSIQQKVAAPELLPVKDGHLFDLGGRKIEVIETPGHTPGEIVLLDKANKQLFTGDNDNGLVWLFLSHSLPLETYLKSLKKLNARAAEFSTIYPGHGGPMPSTFVAEQIGCVEGILDGSLPNELYHSFVGDARLSKYKSAQVAFNPENLRLKK